MINASATEQSAVAVRARPTTSSVTSKDGTRIGYRQLGRGPGVVLVHGSMSSGYNHIELAEALADAFTVYMPDRRGRGLSGPYGDDHTIHKEVEDIDAVLAQTGAQHVFGLSSGAIIGLLAALSLPAIDKAAIFEPPLFMRPAVPNTILSRFDQEMAHGKVAAALITGMCGAQVGPPIFNLLPRRLLEFLTNRLLASEQRKPAGDYVPMRTLAPTLHYDFQLVAETSGKPDRFRAIHTEVLLLGGGKSPAYLKAALGQLEKVLPHSKAQKCSCADVLSALKPFEGAGVKRQS